MIHFKIYRTVIELPKEWDALVVHDIFLQSNYLLALENSSPSNISWFYLGVFDGSQLAGVAIIQRVELYLEDIFRNYKDSCYQQKFKHFVSKFLKGNMLVVGNLMHTGQHGIYFDSNILSQKSFLEEVYKGIKELKVTIKKEQNKRIRIVMLKDYFPDNPIHQEREFFEHLKFHMITVQPNMVMAIRPTWTKIEDYLPDLSTKYRQRYKVANKKAGNIVKRELTTEDIELHSNRLYELYKNVSDNAKINTFILPKGHFFALKKQLKANFKVFSYFLNEELIGFYTLILNNEVLETYFLGYDEEHQYSNQLYLNMLYEMAEFGMLKSFKSIVYARTAMEIKSSVGAKPQRMNVYLKHTNGLMNAFLKQIFRLMNPKQDWEERHPFK